MKRGVAYSDQEDAMIIDMARRGVQLADIAKEVGRTIGSVRDRMDRLVAQGDLSREARLSTKKRAVAQPTVVGAGANGWAIRCAGAVHSSAIDRAKVKADQMIAAGMDPSAARLDVKQTMGLAI